MKGLFAVLFLFLSVNCFADITAFKKEISEKCVSPVFGTSHNSSYVSITDDTVIVEYEQSVHYAVYPGGGGRYKMREIYKVVEGKLKLISVERFRLKTSSEWVKEDQ